MAWYLVKHRDTFTFTAQRGSSVTIVTRLRLDDRDSIPGRGNEGILPSSPPRPDRLWGLPTLLSNGDRG